MEAIENATYLYLSAVSLWELSNHVRLEEIILKIPYKTFYQKAINQFDIKLIPLNLDSLDYTANFQYQIIQKHWSKSVRGIVKNGVKLDLHKDPFDRMIIAEALNLNIPVVSPDELFPHYQNLGLQVIW